MQYPLDDEISVESWHLNAEQIKQFETQGFIKQPYYIPAKLLSKRQHEANIIELQPTHGLCINDQKRSSTNTKTIDGILGQLYRIAVLFDSAMIVSQRINA